MAIDLSILKNIDFTSPDNLIFLAVILLIVVSLCFVVVLVIAKTIKVIKLAIIKIFNLDVKKAKFDRKNGTEWLHQKGEEKKEEVVGILSPKNPVVNFDGKKSEEKVEEPHKEEIDKSIEEGLSKIKSSGSSNYKPKISGGNFLTDSTPSSNEEEEKNIEKVVQNYQDKEKKDIEESLGKLKGVNQANPMGQVGGISKISLGSTIKIPISSNVQGRESSLEKLKTPVLGSRLTNRQAKQDDSIFGGRKEISREKLKEEMEDDTKIWKASVQEGLNLKPLERAKLVKEVFASNLGENISRTDLKISLKRLNEKMLSTKNPNEHARLRKEIKFFKKIGGIK